ncbi:hypothetical protein P3T65_26260 [Pseudomonas nitroreducens]|uniref:hypothetical protein n=1 Tax=Pseudomonas nitroreducens TaxID=46680 RepID=UPI0023F843B4|nr:hypothetical protein [Pseudomonas nitroreducens]WEW97692.1 hypothetical protein P3T65_26260 [Pseudomonas nitroreducens]
MRFINNFLTQLTGQLLAGAGGLPISSDALARLGPGLGGEYLLTITSSLDPLQQTAFEIVRVTFSGGAAVLQRGREGTSDQTWPAGAFVYASVTAGLLADLEARLAALEAGGGLPDNLLTMGGNPLVDDQGRYLIAQS